VIDDNSSQDKKTRSDYESIIASTLNAFDVRLEKLEKPEEKSTLEKIQKNASFFALIVGIILSLISLFNVFWSQPRDALFRDLAEFNKSVNAVANLRQNMIQVQFQSSNPQMVIAMNSMVTPQVLANIQYATSLLPQLGDSAGVPQLIVLISEAMNIYDWKSARILVDRALAEKNSVPALQSEALRYKARLMFFTGNLPEGRKAYEGALDALASEAAFGIDGVRAYIVADWVVAEFSMGDCSIGNLRVAQFIELVNGAQVLPSNRSGLVNTLKNQLNQSSRCAMPSNLQDINLG
jgi:hypothetical protein